MSNQDEPRRRASDFMEPDAAVQAVDQRRSSDQMRDANEHLVIAVVRAEEDIAKHKKAEELLSALVRELESAKEKLQDKNDDLEKFHDLTVDRELKMIHVEKKCEALKRECDVLKRKLGQLRDEKELS